MQRVEELTGFPEMLDGAAIHYSFLNSRASILQNAAFRSILIQVHMRASMIMPSCTVLRPLCLWGTGRVKTLHPGVHGGILARRDLPEHLEAVGKHNISLIDVVRISCTWKF